MRLKSDLKFSISNFQLPIPGGLLAAFVFIALALAAAVSCFAQDRSQARSMVITRQGIVASEHPLASQIGARVLEEGGNAVDAAVAANATMGVVAPMANGMGGDLFAIVYEAKTGKIYGLNASGWTPADLTASFLREKGITNMPQAGIHSVTVPGAVEGWDKLLKRFGRLQEKSTPIRRSIHSLPRLDNACCRSGRAA